MKTALMAVTWGSVGVAKMAALLWLIDGHWQRAVLALLLAWALAGAGLALRRRVAA